MDTQKFKIGIIGLGPVGMILAVHFKNVGCKVALCDRLNERIPDIKQDGIHLVGKIEKSCIFEEVYGSVNELINNGCNLLVSCIKTYCIDELLKEIKDIPSNFYLLTAQNGIDIGKKYSESIDESKILRIIVNFAGNSLSPNTVKVTYSAPPNYIASIGDYCPDVANWIAGILTFSDQETILINSYTLLDEVWKKTILISAISPLCGLTKLTIKEAMQSTDTIEVIEQTILEAMQVARAEGIRFEDNFVKNCLRQLKNAGDHFPSLGNDILSGGETEIDFNNGKIVAYGRKHYIQTPLNLTYTNLVNALSNKNLGKMAKQFKF